MRFVIVGAGAVGGSLGASLYRSGQEVILVARGAQLEAIQHRGLRIETPEETFTVEVPVAASPQELRIGAGDVVVLAIKSQDTEAALRSLAASASPETPILCLQNGVDNERAALRYFDHVYGAMVIVPATYLVPGIVTVGSAPMLGICDVGRYPTGSDSVARSISEALNNAKWASDTTDEIIGWKYSKLLDNLSNAAQLVLGLDHQTSDVVGLARAEGLACLAAADVHAFSTEEMQARRRRSLELRSSAGQARVGASTWQSIARGTGSVETDYLNGEIVMLGRLHGVPTPVNRGLQLIASAIARGERKAGSLTEAEFLGAYAPAALND